MKHLIMAGAVVAMLLATEGCGGPAASAGPASYLAVSNSKVAFIQWRNTSDGHLRGTITEDRIGGSGPAQRLSVSMAPFTGTRTGNSVRLTFGVWYFLRTRARGKLSGGVLTMVVPQSDGTLRRATFSQSDKAGYDRAIATLRRRIRHANLLAAEQQARQRRQPAHAQSEQSAQSALGALYEDSSLAIDGRLASDLARFARHIRAARSHLAAEKRDASGDNKYCGAAFTATGDAQAVNGALQSAQGDILAIMPDIVAVRHDAVVAIARLRHLSRAGLPAPSLASDVIATATVRLRHAIATANSYIDQINAIDAQARSMADNMATRSCSGARSGNSPHPIPHIK